MYALGSTGSGRLETVEAVLADRARTQATPSDRCYVQNFADASKPKALRLVRHLNQEVTRLTISSLTERMRKSFEDVPAVLDYLRDLESDIVEHAEELFLKPPRGRGGTAACDRGDAGAAVL